MCRGTPEHPLPACPGGASPALATRPPALPDPLPTRTAASLSRAARVPRAGPGWAVPGRAARSHPAPGLLPPLTRGQLHPRTDLVDGGCVTEEEEDEADDAGDDEHHREPDEEGCSFESSRGQTGEVREAAPAGEFPAEAVADAVVEEPEVARLRSVHAVPDPVRLDEAHHVDDGKADGEDGPEHADGPRVPHVVGVVDLSRLLSREHPRCYRS